MPSAFNAEPDLGTDPLLEDDDADFVDDYDEMFEEEDFAALGVDPLQPTTAKPGSEDKVLMLAARYASGLPLWHQDDCYDHGPAEVPSLEDEVDDED